MFDGCCVLYVNDNPIGPPTVGTVGEENERLALPFARFTVNGPAVSVGDGPGPPIRMLIVNRFAHFGPDSPYESRVFTPHVYAPPSWRTPAGTVHVVAACHGDHAIPPVFASAPVAIVNRYSGVCPNWFVAGGADSVGVKFAS